VAAFATSLPGHFASVLSQIVSLGFTHVDLIAEVDRPAEQLETLADSGLLVSCLALGSHLPAGHSLDAADVAVRRSTLAFLQRQVADAARLGATIVYLVPGTDRSTTALSRFAEGCALLADYAAARMLRLCIEHVPGRALATAEETLEWLERVGHPQIGMLLDVGHCLISSEDSATIVRQASERLGYVHLDDNDGAGDLHWPLLTGCLTRGQIDDTIEALEKIAYRGALSLELNPMSPDPVEALREGKRLIDQAIRGD
jgi:sugar phosphate isomerase/epimerase